MRLNVNPTRQELFRLKKRLILARRGHKLLKDKQEELLRHFLAIFEEVKKQRQFSEERWRKLLKIFAVARNQLWPPEWKLLLAAQPVKLEVELGSVQLLNIRASHYTVKESPEPVRLYFSELVWDVIIAEYQRIIPEILSLAEKENILRKLAAEIERTRRRVNALEYILIPNLLETIRYITMRLAENERSDITRLLKIKELVGR